MNEKFFGFLSHRTPQNIFNKFLNVYVCVCIMRIPSKQPLSTFEQFAKQVTGDLFFKTVTALSYFLVLLVEWATTNNEEQEDQTEALQHIEESNWERARGFLGLETVIRVHRFFKTPFN